MCQWQRGYLNNNFCCYENKKRKKRNTQEKLIAMKKLIIEQNIVYYELQNADFLLHLKRGETVPSFLKGGLGWIFK